MEAGELIQGTLEMLILKALLRGPLHGYSVAEWIQETSQQMLRVEEAHSIRRCTAWNCAGC